MFHRSVRMIVAFMAIMLLPVFASAQSFTATGIYMMGDNDSPKIAKSEARADALRSITEQAGTYVESFSRQKDNELTQDEVTIIAASIVRVIKEEPAIVNPQGDQLICYVTVTAEADTSNLNMEEILKHKTVMQTAEKIQKSGDDERKSLAEKYAYADPPERSDIERLVNANDDKDFVLQEAAKAIANGKPDRAIRLLKVHEWEQKYYSDFNFHYLYGVALYDKGDLMGARDVFNAIENNYNQTHPDMFRAKYYLGVIAYKRGYYSRAYNCLKFAWDHSPQDDDAMKDWYIKAYEAYVDKN